jgi:Bardet-Biedl syndrome 9 protein
MTHLLRTCLAKNAKESAAVPQPLAMPIDTTKLKKHITIVCDRLAKGARLHGGNVAGTKASGTPKKSSKKKEKAAPKDEGSSGAGAKVSESKGTIESKESRK